MGSYILNVLGYATAVSGMKAWYSIEVTVAFNLITISIPFSRCYSANRTTRETGKFIRILVWTTTKTFHVDDSFYFIVPSVVPIRCV